MDAALPLAIICVGMATYGFSASLTSALTAIGKTRTILLTLALASAVELTASAALTSPLGLPGAALGRALMYVVMLLLLIHLARRHLTIAFDRQALSRGTAASAITALALYLLAAPTGFALPLIPLYLAVGVVVYVLVLCALRALTLADLQLLAKIIPGGTNLYDRALKTVKSHPALTTLAKKLLA